MKKSNNKIAGFLLAICLFCELFVNAQSGSISGVVKDAKNGTAVSFSSVAAYKLPDSTLVGGTTTDDNGNFKVEQLAAGTYFLKVSFLGYETLKTANVSISSGGEARNIGQVNVVPSVTSLKTVTVATQQTRAEQNGDTTQFNANAYKTNPDATAEDLVKKLPGVSVNGTSVQVNGEDVKKILIDGKPFMGDDPSATLKNFPADMIDKVQVYDKLSDQAAFTGFRDGNEEKAINLITKSGKQEGLFGKVYGGYGTDSKYNAGFTLNKFSGPRRISLIGMSNNINQQNFSVSDIMGLVSNSGQGASMRGPNSAARNFLTSQQGGITQTTALGLNYIDNWGKKITVSGSYFFNETDNSNVANSVRTYYTANRLKYDQTSNSTNDNINHRINFKLQYVIDSSNSITLTPRLTLQQNKSNTLLNGLTTLADASDYVSKTNNTAYSKNDGINFNNDLLLQHKMHKKGRTISLNVNTQVNNRSGDGNTYSSNLYNDSVTTNSIINRSYTSASKSNTLGATLEYTEPIGKISQLMISYAPSITRSDADKTTNSVDSAGDYTLFDSTLSNKYTTNYTTQRGGLNYMVNTGKMNMSLGADVQQAVLTSSGVYPSAFALSKTMFNVLPSLSLNYKFSKTKNLNIRYSTATNAPAVSQMQNVLDISNPLLVKMGNADLRQTTEYNYRMRLAITNKEKARNFFMHLMASYVNNYISNATYILAADSTIQGYKINKGSQLTKPVNVDGYYSLRAFGVYTFPLSFIKCNLNLNGGYSYTHTPALINDVVNYSDNYSPSGGIYLSSNISEAIDFSLAYNGSYNVVKNTLQVQSNNAYFNQTATLRINYILKKRIVFNTDINQTYYSGLTQSYNQNFLLWNAYIGYKFLKTQALEAKVSVFDLLKQNKGISRTITETYYEDSNTNVLTRYFMFTLTYTFKHFKGGAQMPEQPDFPKGMPPPGTIHPPGGGGPPH